MEEEGKVYVTSRIAFIGNYVIVGILLVLLVLVYAQFNLTFNLFPQTLGEMTSSLIILGFLLVIAALIEEPVWRRVMHHYIIADKEIIYKSGLIKKKRMTMPYQSVADVKIEKSAIGRVFNFGDVVVNGFKDTITLHGIRHPEELYEQLREKIRPKGTGTVYKKE